MTNAMKTISIAALITCVLLVSCQRPTDVVVPEVQVSTFVSPTGYSAWVWNLAFDTADNLYVSDTYSHIIRKVSPTGVMSVFAGSGTAGLADGVGSQAQFLQPQGITVDPSGNVYVAQYLALRKITSSGVVSTLAGTDYKAIDFSRPDSILFVTTPSVILDKKMNLFITDYADMSYMNRILKITPDRKVSVFLGRQFSYPKNTIISNEQIRRPTGLAFDSKENLFVTDQYWGIIKVTPDGQVSQFGNTGSGYINGPIATATFGSISSLAIDKSDNLYVGDGRYIRKITPDGIVSTIAGSSETPVIINGQTIYKDGSGSQAQFKQPQSMAFDSKGNLFVADGGGIRKIVINP